MEQGVDISGKKIASIHFPDKQQEVQSISDNRKEIDIALNGNFSIGFRKYEWEKAYFSNGFFVVETDKGKYMYNCSTIKSIEIA